MDDGVNNGDQSSEDEEQINRPVKSPGKVDAVAQRGPFEATMALVKLRPRFQWRFRRVMSWTCRALDSRVVFVIFQFWRHGLGVLAVLYGGGLTANNQH